MFGIYLASVISLILCLQDIICDQNIDERISWREWWSYEGPSGPIRWGSLDTSWFLCSKGMYQSPINILPKNLLFDPNLMRLNLDIRQKIPGNLVNTGHDLTFLFDEVMIGMFNISGGPLMYNYKINEIKVHYGRNDNQGSEHMVDGATFAGEIQFIGYNLDIYKTINEARKQPFGTAIIAVMAEIGDPDSSAFQTLVSHGSRITYKGESIRLDGFNMRDLLPKTNYYVTYEGSFTQPGCQETVTWIILNKPIYITKSNLRTLRRLYSSTSNHEALRLDNSRRPVMPLNNRVVKTNINYPSRNSLCSMNRDTFYQMNPSLDL